MFDLSDKIVDDILFAMENQGIEYMVDAETGNVVTLADDDPEAALHADGDLIAAPQWTSGDGYSMMESFARGVGDPVMRNALIAALARGKGVFKAFKAALDESPELERRWFDYKRGAMARHVAAWYDAARIARGLERLGPEPEERDDLLDGDFSFRLAGKESWPLFRALVDRGRDDALSSFPKAIVEFEFASMELEAGDCGKESLVIAIAEAIGGAVAGIAVARKVFTADGSFGRLIYLYVAPEHRRLGLGLRLAEAARTALARDGIFRLVVDMGFLPSGFGSSLSVYGYEAFGSRYLSTSD